MSCNLLLVLLSKSEYLGLLRTEDHCEIKFLELKLQRFHFGFTVLQSTFVLIILNPNTISQWSFYFQWASKEV